jgi:hypothetical protein
MNSVEFRMRLLTLINENKTDLFDFYKTKVGKVNSFVML